MYMRQIARVVVLLALVALIAAPLAAQERKRKGKRQRDGRRGAAAQLHKKLAQLDLTAEQKDKIKKIVGEFQPKLKEVTGLVKLTPEQRKAGTEARKKAMEEGKKGKEVREAVTAAMKLSDQQIAAQKKQQELMRDLNKAIMEVLTPEQMKKFRKGKDGQRKGKGGKGRKKRDK